MILAALLGGIFFGLAGFAGVLIGNAVADTVVPFEDGPTPGKPPLTAIVAGCAAIGILSTLHAQAPAQLAVIAIVCAALAAAWCCDARTGIVPDLFTLAPLGMILAVALWTHEWWILVSSAIPILPFGIAALLSGGRGMGWGDVKLAALGGGVLGGELALLAFALACGAAVAVARVRGKGRAPIAFAPYLAAAIGLALPFGLMR